MRLNRFLASAGLGSRRSCEELIRSGQVTINGALCSALATQVEPSDVVKVGNRVLHSAAPMTLVLHKPPGFVCTAADTHDRRTVFDLLPPDFPRLFHVGRLDKESEGLLILTNDGTLSLKLTHPRYKVEKEYEAVLDQPFDFSKVDKLLHGMHLQEGWAKAEGVYRLAANKLKVVLRQGMKRQIRLMFYELGYEVTKLTRVRIGSIHIEDMPPAHWRALKQEEIEELLAGAGTGESEEPTNREESIPAPKEGAGEQPPRAPRPPRKPVASRAPQDSPRPPRAPRSDRPDRSPRPYSDRPKRFGPPRGEVEAIPFVPRASRGDAERGERPALAPHGDRPFRGPRDSSGSRPPRGDRPNRSAGPRGRVEEIPFVPRASRGGAEGGERPSRPARASGPYSKNRDDSRREGPRNYGPKREGGRPERSFSRPSGPPKKKRFQRPGSRSRD